MGDFKGFDSIFIRFHDFNGDFMESNRIFDVMTSNNRPSMAFTDEPKSFIDLGLLVQDTC